MAYVEQRPGEPTPSRRAGWSAGWWVVFVVVIALIIWAIGWGWGDRELKRAATPTAGIEGMAPAGSGTEADLKSVDDIVGAENKQLLANQSVRLEDVKVQRAAGDRAFWVGEDTEDTVLVIAVATPPTAQAGEQEQLPQAEQAPPEQKPAEGEAAATSPKVREGQEVTLHGTVHQVSSPDDLQQRYGLGEDDIQKLRGQQVYIIATEIVAKQNQ